MPRVGPCKAVPEFAYSWQDAEWHFVTAEHRDLFANDPERYAPQFGGFCAMALTEDVVKVVDPEAWTIVDGKLYLNFSKKGRGQISQGSGRQYRQIRGQLGGNRRAELILSFSNS